MSPIAIMLTLSVNSIRAIPLRRLWWWRWWTNGICKDIPTIIRFENHANASSHETAWIAHDHVVDVANFSFVRCETPFLVGIIVVDVKPRIGYVDELPACDITVSTDQRISIVYNILYPIVGVSYTTLCKHM